MKLEMTPEQAIALATKLLQAAKQVGQSQATIPGAYQYLHVPHGDDIVRIRVGAL